MRRISAQRTAGGRVPERRAQPLRLSVDREERAMNDSKDRREEDGLKGHFGKPDGGYETQSADAGQRPMAASADGEPLYGDHMSGRYGTPAYGRADGRTSAVGIDPSQQSATDTRSTEAKPTEDAGQNAQIGGASGYQAMPAARDDERNAPGISTDKRSDDTKPA
jgi:hypothetical protein